MEKELRIIDLNELKEMYLEITEGEEGDYWDGKRTMLVNLITKLSSPDSTKEIIQDVWEASQNSGFLNQKEDKATYINNLIKS